MKPLFASVDKSKFKNGRVHFKNSDVKGLNRSGCINKRKYLRHQHCDMYNIHSYGCIIYSDFGEITLCVKYMSILVLAFTKHTNSINNLVIVDTSTKYTQVISVNEDQPKLSKCLRISSAFQKLFF